MKARIKWIEGVSFVAETGSGHAVVVDGAPEAGGRNLGARPMELVLAGAAACTAFDVVWILKKARQPVTDCVVEAEADRAAVEPKVFTRIRLDVPRRRARARPAPGREGGEALQGEILLGDDHARQDRRDHDARSRSSRATACRERPASVGARFNPALRGVRRSRRRPHRDAAHVRLDRRQWRAAASRRRTSARAARCDPGTRSCSDVEQPHMAAEVGEPRRSVRGHRRARRRRCAARLPRPGGSTSDELRALARPASCAPTSFSGSVDSMSTYDHRRRLSRIRPGAASAFSQLDVGAGERRSRRAAARAPAQRSPRALLARFRRSAARAAGSTCPSGRRPSAGRARRTGRQRGDRQRRAVARAPRRGRCRGPCASSRRRSRSRTCRRSSSCRGSPSATTAPRPC